MEIGKTLYVHKREDWRAWLADNFQTEEEIWLVNPNKASGKPKLLYNDAVEEALCFGWIDSIVKKLNTDSAVQRYTPRNPKSGFSQQNKERLRWLAEHDLIHTNVQESIQPVLEEEFIFPKDILAAIKANPKAWEHYQQFSPAYQRIRIAWIENARVRPEIFDKRLATFIQKTEKNRQIGYGGIDKYF
jgi:uncharacterized protein YdeI (YjbR/CyaY-like superfamily)